MKTAFAGAALALALLASPGFAKPILLAGVDGSGEARARFEQAVHDLGEDEWSRRDRAERDLSGPLGLAFREELADLARGTASLEERHRLERIAAALERLARANEAAGPFRSPGPGSWRILAACLRAPDPARAAAAHAALVAETGRGLPADASAWEAALR